MQAQLLDDSIASLLPIYSIRKISTITSLSRDPIRAVCDARSSETQLLHIRVRPAKVTHEIKQAVIELTLQNPTFSHVQIAYLIRQRFGIAIARTTTNRLRHLGHFNFLPPKRCHVVTERRRCQRIQFAHDYLTGKFPLQNLLLSNESRFCMGSDNPPVWNDAKDERLLSLVAEKGRSWRMISTLFADITEVECKSRWMFSNKKCLR
jgi:hypothetical protein